MVKTKRKCGYCPQIKHKIYLGCLCYDCYQKKVWLNADWREKSVEIRLKGNYHQSPILPKMFNTNHNVYFEIGDNKLKKRYYKRGDPNGTTIRF